MKFRFIVELEVDSTHGLRLDDTGYEGYRPTVAEAREYVKNAVIIDGGGRHPTDPFFAVQNVKVTSIRKEAASQ
jgi:hypothetical protein